MATPFKGSLVFQTKYRRWNVPFTASDVTTAAVVFQDGGTVYNLPVSEGPVALVDVILTAAGVDTSQAYIYANQKDTGERIYGALNIGTVLNRQIAASPIGFKPGTQLKITQVT
jgi:hypothetical protein